MKKHAHGLIKKKKQKKNDFDPHFFLLFPFLFSSFPPSLFSPFSAHLLHPAIWDRLKRYRFDSTSKIEVENDFFEKIFLTFFPTLQASNWLLINADFFIFPALISAYVPSLWYQNMRHICSLVGMRVDQKVLFVNYALVRSGRRKDMVRS